MQIRFSSILSVTAFVTAAAAAPAALEARDDCSTGSIQCCDSTQTSIPTSVSELAGLLGIVLPVVDGLVGLGCDPITVIGLGSGASCTSQAVCCTGNTFNGLINLGCSPINISL